MIPDCRFPIVEVTKRHPNIQSAFKNQQSSIGNRDYEHRSGDIPIAVFSSPIFISASASPPSPETRQEEILYEKTSFKFRDPLTNVSQKIRPLPWPLPLPAHFEPCFSGQKLAMSLSANGCATSRWPIKKPSVPTFWWCSGSAAGQTVGGLPWRGAMGSPLITRRSHRQNLLHRGR